MPSTLWWSVRSLGKDGVSGCPLDIVLFYLDDGLLCGSAEAVAVALAFASPPWIVFLVTDLLAYREVYLFGC